MATPWTPEPYPEYITLRDDGTVYGRYTLLDDARDAMISLGEGASVWPAADYDAGVPNTWASGTGAMLQIVRGIVCVGPGARTM